MHVAVAFVFIFIIFLVFCIFVVCQIMLSFVSYAKNEFSSTRGRRHKFHALASVSLCRRKMFLSLKMMLMFVPKGIL